MKAEYQMDKKHFGAIDGLRTMAAIGIVMMHMKSNNVYEISGYVYDTVIPSFTNFTILFMIISAFGMCCGYYEKILYNKISVTDFYSKRFKKVLPFFAFLVLIDIMVSPSSNSIYEGFADLTLLFGLLPNAGNISVIGVGWFLGLIFVFYLCFPFFCVLLENKKRAWLAFGISLIYNFACTQYFEVGRSNILYSSCFFMVGGLIYLYREDITKLNKWTGLVLLTVALITYYVLGGNLITWMLVGTFLLTYAVACSGGALENRFTRFFGGISMEIYLSHMFIFRVIEKMKLNTIFGNGWIQYCLTVLFVISGTAIFAVIMQYIFKLIRARINI